jgi:hypothetical protein
MEYFVLPRDAPNRGYSTPSFSPKIYMEIIRWILSRLKNKRTVQKKDEKLYG